MFTQQQLADRAQIERLAYELNTRIVPTPDPTTAMADPKNRVLYLYPPNDRRFFWGALHELGHIADQPKKDYYDDAIEKLFGIVPPSTVDAEARAWVWAFEHANRALTEDERAQIAFSFGSYIHGADPRDEALRLPAVRDVIARVGRNVRPSRVESWYGKNYPESIHVEMDNGWIQSYDDSVGLALAT